jgi:hypothetical protein
VFSILHLFGIISDLCVVYVSHRLNGCQGYVNLEGSPPSAHGMQPGYIRSMSKPLHHGSYSTPQNPLSRLGQQSSQIFQQHFQYQYHPQSMLNPDQQLVSNTFGQLHIHQSSNVGHCQLSNGGRGSGYSLSSTQIDTRAEHTRVSGIGSRISIGAPGHANYPQDHFLESTSQCLPGIPHTQGQGSLTNEISWGTHLHQESY